MNLEQIQEGDWLWTMYLIGVATAFGWAFFDGRKRLSPAYRARIANSLEKMPDGARERFLVLFLPQQFVERFTQALIIGLGTAIILLPVWVVVGCLLAKRPVFSLSLSTFGGITGAVLGEFLLNSRAARDAS